MGVEAGHGARCSVGEHEPLPLPAHLPSVPRGGHLVESWAMALTVLEQDNMGMVGVWMAGQAALVEVVLTDPESPLVQAIRESLTSQPKDRASCLPTISWFGADYTRCNEESLEKSAMIHYVMIAKGAS